MNKKVVVVGVGNILCGDDGIGVRAAELLNLEPLPPEVSVLDGGTIGIDILYLIEDADYAIIIDAIDGGAEPGAMFRIPWEDIADDKPEEQMTSLHDFNLVTVLSLANYLGKMPRVVIFGVQPENIKLGDETSPAVNATLPALIQSVKKEINDALT